MTISNSSRTAGPFNGNGVTVNFPFSFKVFTRSDVLVALTNIAGNESILTIDADYTITLNGDQNTSPGGVIKMKVAPVAGEVLAATSAISMTQTLELTNNGGFYPRAINDALDRIVIQIQQLAARVGVGLNVGAAAAVAKVLGFIEILAAAGGSSNIGFLGKGDGAVGRLLQSKLREFPSVCDFGAVGDSAVDDTAAAKLAVAALPQRGHLAFPPGAAFKITDTLKLFGKAGAVIDFGNQQINSGNFASPRPAIHFKGMSQAVIDNIFVIGSKENTSTGVLFEADSTSITIHANVGKVYAANCNVGIQVGSATYWQFSDSSMDDLLATDCNIGIVLSGENTLAMRYGRVAAFNNAAIGVQLEQGGGTIESLQIAASGNDLFIGQTSGMNHGKLARWDILSGYSEEGVAGERFINSTACADDNPFQEQIVLNGYRVTPFSSTNVTDFIRWCLNGDLILRNCTIGHGQQLPFISLDHNTQYRAPKVVLDDCVIDCNPKSSPQVPMSYRLTDPRQQVEISARVNNGMSWWNNKGATNEGVIARGIYMRKLQEFEAKLLSIGSLVGAWSLRDLSSGVCRNSMPGYTPLALSAPMETRDFWMDDGLIGFFRNASTSKSLSTSSTFLAGEYTFGCFLRAVTPGVDETDQTALGGAGGIRLGIGNAGGAFARVQVGAFNCQATPLNPYDAHLLIGRYLPKDPVGTEVGFVKLDCINLRTGAIEVARVASGPALGDLAWNPGLSIRNDGCVRGFPFVYSRALTDPEVFGLLQSALKLTDSWRLS